MSAQPLNMENLDFQRATGLGSDNPILRSAVGLQARCYDEAGVQDYFRFGTAAEALSSYLHRSTPLVALDKEYSYDRAVASVLCGSSGYTRYGGRKALELDDIYVDPEYGEAEQELLEGVMVALSCQGRGRIKPVVATIRPTNEVSTGVLEKLGFRPETLRENSQRDEDEILRIASGTTHMIAAGQLAIHRAAHLTGGQKALQQARLRLHWN